MKEEREDILANFEAPNTPKEEAQIDGSLSKTLRPGGLEINGKKYANPASHQ